MMASLEVELAIPHQDLAPLLGDRILMEGFGGSYDKPQCRSSCSPKREA